MTTLTIQIAAALLTGLVIFIAVILAFKRKDDKLKPQEYKFRRVK